MKNIVISLKNATDRREHIINEFSKQGIDFEFFDAITPDLLDETCQKLGINLIKNQRLSNGEKAVFLSHVYLWQKMLDENIEYLAIFEDDVFLGKNAHLFLNHDAWVQDIKFDIIKLETWKELVHLSHNNINIFERQLKILKSTHVGACGYIISQKAAAWLVNYLMNDFDIHGQAIDHVLFGTTLNRLTVYQLTPALSIQSDRYNNQIKSNLEKSRNNQYKHPMSFLQKIKRRLTTWKRSILKRLVYKIVPFQ